jgi:hypothetical protein
VSERMTRRRGSTSPVADWDTDIELPDGRRLTRGDEFTVTGQGRFRFVRQRPNGELNCWGPIPRNGVIRHGSIRTFAPGSVATVHRNQRANDTLRREENQ